MLIVGELRLSTKYYYAIGVVDERNDPIDGTYQCAPEGCVGWIDTRPVTGEITTGFFAFHTRPSHLAGTHTIIGDGSRLEEYYPNISERAAWEALYGVQTYPSDTLHGMLVRLLTEDADPDGYERCRPLTVDHRGNYEIHLGGHSRIFRQRFRGVHDRLYPNLQRLWKKEIEKSYNEAKNQADKIRNINPNDPKGKQIAEKAKNMKGKPSYGDMREIMAKEIEARPGKQLTELCRLHKVKKEELMPDGIEIELKKPTTRLYDDFERADILMGVYTDPQPGDLWLATSNANWLITDGQAWYNGVINNGLGQNSFRRIWRNAQLSSSNCTVRVDVEKHAQAWIGVTARTPSYDSLDCYAFFVRAGRAALWHFWGTSSYSYLFDISVGALPTITRLTCDGSTLSGYRDDNVLVESVTNTAFPSGGVVGMFGHTSNNTTVTRCNWWEARDLLAASIPPPLLSQHYI